MKRNSAIELYSLESNVVNIGANAGDGILLLNDDDFHNKKIAIISDVHSNADALLEVIELIEELDISSIIVMGDLFTYGCQPQLVLDAFVTLAKRYPCFFIKGNHDQFYFDNERGLLLLYEMPEFVIESINWTINNFDGRLSNMFTWYDAIVIGRMFFAHANPFGYENWTYLNSDESCKEAARVLKEQGYTSGIFGHTHRKKDLIINDNTLVKAAGVFEKDNENAGDIVILNPGSIGQPRGEGASFLVCEITSNGLAYEFIDICPDLTSYFDAIEKSTLSKLSRDKLMSFWKR